MFNFGLFASHIPYIVVIVGYLLYLATYSFNKISDADQGNSQYSANSYEISPDEVQDGQKNIALHNAEKKQHQKLVDQQNYLPNVFYWRDIVPMVNAKKLVSGGFSYHLFSRPPPQLILSIYA